MATYRPSFVDVSGLTSGISRGLEIAAEKKKQQDQLAEARIDDFMKMYQPGKLRAVDIPEFTNAFNQYKQSALLYSKMNRGGAKPEELAAANQQMNKALSNLNGLYGTSVRASEKMAEYADAIKIGRQKGLSIPNDMLTSSNMLASTPANKLNVDQIPSAYAYKLLSEDYDLAKVNKDLDNLGAKARQAIMYQNSESPMYKYMGRDIYGRTKVTTETRDPRDIVKALPLVLLDPSNNGLKLAMDRQYEQFSNADAQSKGAIVENLKQFFGPNVNEQNITPQMLLASSLAFRGISKMENDDMWPKIQIQEINKNLDLNEKQKDRALQYWKFENKEDVSDYHPSVIIKSLVEDNDPILLGGVKDGMQRIGGYNVTEKFKGFTIKDDVGNNIPVEKVELIPGYGNVKPYFSVQAGGQTQEFQPIAFNRAIVASMPKINFKSGSVSLEGLDIPKSSTQTRKTTGGTKSNDPLGIRKSG